MRGVPWCNAAATASLPMDTTLSIASRHVSPVDVSRLKALFPVTFHPKAAKQIIKPQIQTGGSSITHPALSALWRRPAGAPCRSPRSLSACSSRPG